MARRARSLDRMEEGIMHRLGEVLERAMRQPPAEARDRFKAPTFDGTTDVGFFIRQFEDVAQANQWEEASARIHLRASLTDAAATCGQAEDTEHIFTALRARFGITRSEAKARLVTLRREQRTSLQEHAAEVNRLVSTAYAELPRHHQQEMKLDTFQTSLGNSNLQRHLLAIQPQTLEAAVQAGNDYLQIQPGQHNPVIRQVEEGEGNNARKVDDPVQALLKAVARLTEEVHALKTTPPPTTRRPPPPRQRCYGCDQEGHIRRSCPTKPWPSRQAGNEAGPQ